MMKRHSVPVIILLITLGTIILAGSIVSGEQAGNTDIHATATALRQAASSSTPGTTTWLELQRVADEIDRIASVSAVHEARIRDRNIIIRFFIGGNRTASAGLAGAASRYGAEEARLTNLMTALNFNQTIKPIMLQQTGIIRQERDRLVVLAETENRSKGILGLITG
jgi:hypothetical protein